MITDKLFLLSESEVDKYLPTKKSRICKYNGYLRWWWLRSPGRSTSNTTYVIYDGSLHRSGKIVFNYHGAVRPALHINPDYLQSLERTEEGYVRFGAIKWLVLNEDTGLLLAKGAVCLKHFDSKSNNYEVSEIRAYLNTQLLAELFTEDEQKMIVDTVVDGEKSYPAA